MFKRCLLSGLAILMAWTLIDVLMHRLLLRPMYEQTTNLWRPFDQLNILLIYFATFALIVIFADTYRLLVRPKSLGVGLEIGAFMGLAHMRLANRDSALPPDVRTAPRLRWFDSIYSCGASLTTGRNPI